MEDDLFNKITITLSMNKNCYFNWPSVEKKPNLWLIVKAELLTQTPSLISMLFYNFQIRFKNHQTYLSHLWPDNRRESCWDLQKFSDHVQIYFSKNSYIVAKFHFFRYRLFLFDVVEILTKSQTFLKFGFKIQINE